MWDFTVCTYSLVSAIGLAIVMKENSGIIGIMVTCICGIVKEINIIWEKDGGSKVNNALHQVMSPFVDYKNLGSVGNLWTDLPLL